MAKPKITFTVQATLAGRMLLLPLRILIAVAVVLHSVGIDIVDDVERIGNGLIEHVAEHHLSVKQEHAPSWRN